MIVIQSFIPTSEWNWKAFLVKKHVLFSTWIAFVMILIYIFFFCFFHYQTSSGEYIFTVVSWAVVARRECWSRSDDWGSNGTRVTFLFIYYSVVLTSMTLWTSHKIYARLNFHKKYFALLATSHWNFSLHLDHIRSDICDTPFFKKSIF